MADEPLRLVDLFSGMGCASMGFAQAGFEPAAALEIDPLRCELYRQNVGIDPIRADVMDVTGSDLLRAGGLEAGGKFCVVGCPPCQSFSSLADTSGADSETFGRRGGYVAKFTELVEEMMPLGAVFENVQGMVSGAGRKFFDDHVGALDDAGYDTRHRVVNAADFGVPQNRRRVMAVSVRRDVAERGAMGRIGEFLDGNVGRRRTVKDAIGDLKSLGPGEFDPADPHHRASDHGPRVLERIRSVSRDGGSRKNMPRRLWLDCHKRLARGAETSYGRMRWDEPSPTMTCRCTTPACGRFTHPVLDRGITVREAARLQTIPDDAALSEYVSKNAAIIGDAVPVLLARRIAETLRGVIGRAGSGGTL